MLQVKLVVVGGDAKSTEVDLKLPTIIGRARSSSLRLPHPLVSRHHCELFEKNGRLFVKDLGSTNGTFVDNQRIQQEQLLESEQLLSIGNVTFRAIYEAIASLSKDQEQPASPPEKQEVEMADPALQYDDSLHRRKTRPGSKSSHHPPAVVSDTAAVDGLETVYLPPDNQRNSAAEADRSDRRDKRQEPQDASPPAPEHSVIAALASEGDGAAKSVSLSSIEELQVENPVQADVSSVDILDSESPDAKKQVGQSFLDVVTEPENEQAKKVAADESSLESFIRKIPK